MKKKLTAEIFDAVVAPTPEPRIIWTASAIARRINTSADFVRDKLVAMPGTPVKQIGGRYCAIESELMAFFQPSPTQTQ